MAADVFPLKRGDLEPPIVAVLEGPPDPETGVKPIEDLTSVDSIRFIMRRPLSDRAAITGTATVVGAPSAGTVKYAWVAGDTDRAGSYLAEFELTDNGRRKTFPSDPSNPYIRVVISDDLG